MRATSGRSVLLVVALLAWACGENALAPGVTTPDFQISDGAHGGDQSFYFLPPMVPDPDPVGTFDGGAEPVVEICVWLGDECGPPLELYTTETGPGSETIRVDAEAEHFIVNWHTDDVLDAFPINQSAGESYRIRVLVGNRVLGYADLVVAADRKELKNVDTGQYVGLLDGRTLPIKFRVEEGWQDEGEVLSAGYHASCTSDANGQAYCWGRNVNGELGIGSVGGDYGTPQPVVGGLTFVSVSAGVFHTCGVTTSGDAYCWGYNVVGQLGTGAITAREPSPILVSGGHTFSSVSAAALSTCGVTTDGVALCWGYNGRGSVGNGTITYRELVPTAVAGSQDFASVDAGFYTVCGVTVDGGGLCWGDDTHGQTGQGTTPATGGPQYRVTPTAISGLSFQDLSAGYTHTCGLSVAGDAYCWGRNQVGSVGNGSFSTAWPFAVPSPQPVVGGLSFAQIDAGNQTTCGVTPDGTGRCWGLNQFGQLGDGTTTTYQPYGKASPTTVTGGHVFSRIDVGLLSACGTTRDGAAYCWGDNRWGQLGDGSFNNSEIPVFTFDRTP